MNASKAISFPPQEAIEGQPGPAAIEGTKKKKPRKKVEIGFDEVIAPEIIDIAKTYGFRDPMELHK